MEAAYLSGMGVVPGAIGLDRPAETFVPERGGRVSQLRHRGLAGVEPGHYQNSVSNGEHLL